MRRLLLRTILLVSLAVVTLVAPAQAYRRLKLGPLEFVPTFSVELRQHSNVYLSSDNQAPSETTDVSGPLLDIRPGMLLTLKPKLEKKIRGLYLDVRVAPTLVFFPNAAEVCLQPGGCPGGEGREKPDTFKFDANLFAGARYQMSGRFSLSGGVDYTHPELAQTDARLNDLTVRGGAKYDFSRLMSIEDIVSYKDFETPRDVIRPDGSRDRVPTVFGSFHAINNDLRYAFQIRPTLAVGARYVWHDRQFEGIPIEAGDRRNDFDRDGVPDNGKDYVQQTVSVTANKRLTKQTRGTFEFGKTYRKADQRKFGSRDYESFVGSGTLETLLTKRTRLQASAEYLVTDTLREITFSDLNAFTNDQTGQFTVIPEQFSIAYDQRYFVDFIQNVFRRGDQLLLGVAYQRDRLVDQIGSQNFFIPGSAQRRSILDGTLTCEEVEGGYSCEPVLNNQIQKNFLITSGYRYRPRKFKWLGLQVRGAYYRGSATPEVSDGRRSLEERGLVPPIDTTPVKSRYWSVAGGVVINLQVFQ